ncbi:PEP-CTERM sorting domain-containing protein [Rhodopirellula europaea]|uniref:PEP-CTERM sorting domain-containing protein n=1 Tax=Rhodopirellula europaea TaxID=1263866 RepID=UPI003D2C3031|tara:strand:- start:318 stop:971 length:654 start_codon:yes stop_codon:yes gene_type:complete
MKNNLILVALSMTAWIGSTNQLQAAVVIGGPGFALEPGAVVVDFSDPLLTENEPLTTQFSPKYGIELSGFRYNNGTAFDDVPPDGEQPDIKNFDSSNLALFNSNLSIVFDQDVTDFATSWQSETGPTYTMTSLHNGIGVETILITGGANQRYAFRNSQFDEIQIVAGGGLILDNFQFIGAAAVPEPSSVAMLGLAVCVVVMRRSRQKSVNRDPLNIA